MAHDEKNEQKIYSNVLTMRAIFTAIVLILIWIWWMFIPAYKDTMIPIAIWICCIAVWFNLFFSIITSVLQHKLKMQFATIALIIGKIAWVLAILYIAFFVKDKVLWFYLMVASWVLAHLVMAIISIFFVSKIIKIKFSFDFMYWKYLLKKSIPYWLALIFSTIYFKVDVTMLSILKGQSDVGYYWVPLRMVEVLVVLPLFFMNSVLWTMTKSIKDKIKLNKIFNLSIQFLLLLALPIFIFIFFFSTDIIRIISNENFLSTISNYGSDSVLKLLTIALLLSFFTTLCSFTLIAFEKQKSVLFVNATWALFNILTNLYFIPIYGFIWAAYTSIASEFLILILAIFFLRKYYKFSLDFIRLLKILLAWSFVFVTLYFLIPLMNFNSVLQILVSAIIWAVIYLWVLYKDLIRLKIMN